MSILSDINKVIKDADMLLWYKEEYIPFVIDHIDDIVETPQSPSGVWSADVWYYIAYIPIDYHPNDVSCTREMCIEWLLNNDKIRRIVSTDDTIDGKYCYSGKFLEDSSLIARVFNARWLKLIQSEDSCFKDTTWRADSTPDVVYDMEPNPHCWTMKVDYSNNMKPELSKVYYPIS